MDLKKALVFSDSSIPSSLLMELPHGWELPCQHRGLWWGQWGWGSVPHLPYRIHPSFLCLPETQYGFQPWVLGWLDPCGSPCIVLPLHHIISPVTEPSLPVSPHFRCCYYLSQWTIMIHE